MWEGSDTEKGFYLLSYWVGFGCLGFFGVFFLEDFDVDVGF